MSTYILMRILESAPRRYDLGMRMLTRGRLDRVYDRLASHIQPGHRVLDLGCGTGALTLRAARRGARVKGIDVDAQMLEIAAERVRESGLADSVELVEIGVAELDGEETASYDAVTSGLCFSELSDDQLRYTIEHVARILKPGGLLLIADEIEPRSAVGKWAGQLVRAPLAALTYVLTQQTTRPVAGLPERLKDAGLLIESFRPTALGDFGEFVVRKPDGASS